MSSPISRAAPWPASTTTAAKLWQVNLQEKYGKDSLWWDIGSSPVLAGDRVLVAVMQAGNSYLVALDVATGERAVEGTARL